ncbi:hypothetical protein ACROYT_G004162 [Oculina patagonica]
MLHIWITWLIFLPLQQTFATKSIQRNTNFRFAHFIDHFFHVLDVPELDSTLVTDRNVCLRRCLKDQRCFSTNLAANPDINGNYVCELLPTDKYNASNSFGPSQYFHHYSLKTPCLLDPCQRNGTCQALYEQDDYWCECLRAYVGKQCESERPVCMKELKDQRCFSTNLAANPDNNGNYVCELLPTDKYNASNSFGPSQYFHHYSLKTPCSLDPCKHNSTCHALYEQDDYWCECVPLYVGKNCEMLFAQVHGKVCMGAKGNTYGVFLTPMAGKIDVIKLVHTDGQVGCDQNRLSNWGCRSSTIMTLLTDDNNKVVFPEDYPDTTYNGYSIPGFTSNSPELVFTFTTPLVVTAGQEYRLWYTEDLNPDRYSEGDNYLGPICMNVWLLFSQ